MADDLEQQIDNCKKRIAVIGTLIEDQRAAGLITAEAERVLALEASYLKVLRVCWPPATASQLRGTRRPLVLLPEPERAPQVQRPSVAMAAAGTARKRDPACRLAAATSPATAKLNLRT